MFDVGQFIRTELAGMAATGLAGKEQAGRRFAGNHGGPTDSTDDGGLVAAQIQASQLVGAAVASRALGLTRSPIPLCQVTSAAAAAAGAGSASGAPSSSQCSIWINSSALNWPGWPPLAWRVKSRLVGASPGTMAGPLPPGHGSLVAAQVQATQLVRAAVTGNAFGRIRSPIPLSQATSAASAGAGVARLRYRWP